MQVSPYILLALTSLFWSLNFIIGKILANVMPPATISFFRWLIPCGFLLCFSWQEIWAHAPTFRPKWRLIFFLGATGYGLNSMCVYEAVRFTTTINTSFINAFNPVLIAVAGYVMYRTRIDRVQGLGFFLSLLGVLCIIFQGHWGRVLSLQMNVGDLFMLASIGIWSVHTVLYQRTVPDFPNRAMFTVMMFGGLLATLPFALIEGQLDHWSWVTQVGRIHLAGILGSSETIDYIRKTININVIGALNVLDACHKYDKPLVNVGTPSHNPPWLNPYLISKRCASELALMYARYLDCKVSVVRGQNVYGPGQHWGRIKKAVPTFIMAALRNEPISVFGDGSQIIDLIHVQDFCEIMVRTLELPTWGHSIDAGTGIPTTAKWLAELIIELADSESEIVYKPMRVGEPDQSTTLANPCQTVHLLDYYPRIQLEWGMKGTIEWYKQHGMEVQDRG